jgi:hypothetical protein
VGTCEVADSVNCIPEITTPAENEEEGDAEGVAVGDVDEDEEGDGDDDIGGGTTLSPTPTLGTETETTPSPTIIVSSTENGAATTTTTTGMTNTPTTDLFATVTNAVEEDLNDANSQAAEAALEAEADESETSEEAKEVWIPDCSTATGEQSYTGNIVGPQCTSYAICVSGIVAGVPVDCTEGTLYNKALGVCDHEANVICYTSGNSEEEEDVGEENEEEGDENVVEEESDVVDNMEDEEGEDTTTTDTTPSPTTSTTDLSNEYFPTMPPETRSPSANNQLEDALEYAKDDINTKLLISAKTNSTGGEEWSASEVYRYDDLLRAIRLMYLEGVGDYKFYIGDDDDDTTISTTLGLVNIAAFLAQSMKETIKYDACDENNWDVIDGKYPISNACGQLNQTYQEYTCPADMEHMACEVDSNMEQVAYTNAKWYGAPGPLYCGPKSKYPVSVLMKM